MTGWNGRRKMGEELSKAVRYQVTEGLMEHGKGF